MPKLLLVMLGGAIGAGLRYHIGRLAIANLGPSFPWGTWAVNLLGALFMGVLAGLLIREGAGGEPLRLFLGVGVLGGFTTFSAFSLELVAMLQRGDYAVGLAYALSSVAGSAALLIFGLWATRSLA